MCLISHRTVAWRPGFPVPAAPDTALWFLYKLSTYYSSCTSYCPLNAWFASELQDGNVHSKGNYHWGHLSLLWQQHWRAVLPSGFSLAKRPATRFSLLQPIIAIHWLFLRLFPMHKSLQNTHKLSTRFLNGRGVDEKFFTVTWLSFPAQRAILLAVVVGSTASLPSALLSLSSARLVLAGVCATRERSFALLGAWMNK